MMMRKSILIITLCLFCFNPSSGIAKEEKSRFEKLELFSKILYLIENQYYRKVDTEKLIEGALKGMMSTLDPHSSYLNKDVFAKMQEDTKGEFGGVGIEVTQKDGVLVVITPIEDTPAYKAGILSGDRIVEINHESTVGLSLEKSVEKMRGKAGSKLTIGVIRQGKKDIQQFTIKRKVIKVRPIKEALLYGNYSYVKLIQFQKRSAVSIIAAIKKHRKKSKKGIKGIILDLRNNPGGLLDQAVDVSSIFLDDGVVVSTEGRDPKHKEIRYVKKTGHKELDIPVAVLINGASASASEIVAGALQDHKRAIIIGGQSFGKGSVQTVAKIDDEKGVKLTIAQYMTPSGKKIQAIGIKPDILLSEVEAKFVVDNKHINKYLRERDLRNHLTATIETKEEKKKRLALEKKERMERIKLYEKSKKEKQSKTKSLKREKIKPKDDYMVNQAINYLKSFNFYKKLENPKKVIIKKK